MKRNVQLASENAKQEEEIASLKKVWEIPSDWFPGISCLYRLCHSLISTLLPNWLELGGYRTNVIHCFWTILVYYVLTLLAANRCTPACPGSGCRQELLHFGHFPEEPTWNIDELSSDVLTKVSNYLFFIFYLLVKETKMMKTFMEENAALTQEKLVGVNACDLS